MMSQTTFNLVAIAIFVFTMASVFAPLLDYSQAIPAAGVFGLLGLLAADQWGFEGKGATLFVDWVARRSPEYCDRVAYHEAGHFLVAYLLDIPVTNYALTAWEAHRQGYPARGGVEFSDECFDTAQHKYLVAKSQWMSSPILKNYFTVWMAGIAAEKLVYEKAEGGGDDLQKLRAVLAATEPSSFNQKQKERLAREQARTLLQAHWKAYSLLVEAMKQRQPVSECYQLLERETGIQRLAA
ncbi:ATP-dependent Zn protease [Geitlerinema sp. PCC 9228]|jgi:hypothetical protein|uniref:ATP-dependent Zn protease n=1 Tax=Geitlerinema sp. PCC 9228 TaxID=111611 RepID=UPI001FCE2120|nr:ATP-dependent Zn protease [Geitlerinema sp. PCC 9228]